MVALAAVAMVAFVSSADTPEVWALLPTVGAGTGWALLVIGLVTGRLVTRAAHNERVEAIRSVYQRQVDDIAHDRTEWRAESRIKDAVISELQETNQTLVTEVGGTVVDILKAVKKNQEEAAS